MNTIMQQVFFLGEGIQQATVDGFFDLLDPATWNAAGLRRITSNAVRESAQLARFLTPGQTGYLSWLELQNKLEVFLLVRDIPSILKLNGRQAISLNELVKNAYRLEPFKALWAIEGLGHYFTDTVWEQSGPPRGLLSGMQTSVSENSLLMLHAGMGLSFAQHLINNLVPQSSAAQVRDVIQRFVCLCQENSRPGYMGAAIESLGLVTRDLYPDLVRSVSEGLQVTAPELSGFYWHGVGRALYFSRAYFLPLLRTPWSSIEAEGHTDLERLNLTAGLAWAVNLVNMRSPQIMENLLGHVQQSRLKAGFTNGVSSSIVVRQDTTPDMPFMRKLCSYAGGSTNSSVLWKTLVAAPCEEALRAYPELRKKQMLDQVFRFQPDEHTGRDSLMN